MLVVGLGVLGSWLAPGKDAVPRPPGPVAKAAPPRLAGLSIHMTTDDYGVYLVKAFRETPGAAGVRSLITDARADARRQKEDLQRHIAKKADALVIVPFADQCITRETHQAMDAGTPVVAITPRARCSTPERSGRGSRPSGRRWAYGRSC
ncbi:MAG TPA: substrate-binding domain-containing protein [Archangium sp.]|nr:substrate-binding domain-containing protein [Archangium sp.]